MPDPGGKVYSSCRTVGRKGYDAFDNPVVVEDEGCKTTPQGDDGLWLGRPEMSMGTDVGIGLHGVEKTLTGIPITAMEVEVQTSPWIEASTTNQFVKKFIMQNDHENKIPEVN